MTSRCRAFRTPSRRVRSSSSTPALAASCFSASTNGTPSRCITKLNTSPPSPHPKQCQLSRAGVTTNDGVFSPWNGQRPLYVAPAFLRLTDSLTTSTTFSRLFTSAATPTAKPHPPWPPPAPPPHPPPPWPLPAQRPLRRPPRVARNYLSLQPPDRSSGCSRVPTDARCP